MRYPIKDKQFHERALRELDTDLDDKGSAVIVQWHLTALNCIAVGHYHRFNGPAAWFSINGKEVPALVKEHLELDEHAVRRGWLPYFKPIIW